MGHGKHEKFEKNNFSIGIQQSIKLKPLTIKNAIKDVAKIFIKLLKNLCVILQKFFGETYALKEKLEIY